MRRLSAVLFGATILFSTAAVPALRAQDHDRDRDNHSYHDGKYNDEHRWDNHEDQAYRIYLREHHRKYIEFQRQKEADQQAYWEWRHSHPDSALEHQR